MSDARDDPIAKTLVALIPYLVPILPALLVLPSTSTSFVFVFSYYFFLLLFLVHILLAWLWLQSGPQRNPYDEGSPTDVEAEAAGLWTDETFKSLMLHRPQLPEWMPDTDDILKTVMPYRPRLPEQMPETLLQDIYKPLDQNEIRIIQVLRQDSDTGLLHCSLQHMVCTTDDGGGYAPYSALSYTWNESELVWYGKYDTSPKCVVIDGKLVPIQDKVANMMCLCFHRSRRRLWIDAICIDQSNTAEKDIQVAKMDDIYNAAKEVIIVLGGPSEVTDAFHSVYEKTHTEVDISKWKAMWRLLRGERVLIRNSYWSRSWTLQESILAREHIIIHGTRSLHSWLAWELVMVVGNDDRWAIAYLYGYKALFWFALMLFYYRRLKKNLIGDDRDDKFTPEFAKKVRKKGVDFLGLLVNTRRWRGCMDPRDILYSRVGIAFDAPILVPRISYEIPVQDLYIGFATRYILQYGSLKILAYSIRTPMGLPTWVPDWSGKLHDWSQHNPAVTFYTGLQAKPSFSHNGRRLCVRGRKIADIKRSLPSMSSFKAMFTRYSTSREADSFEETPAKGDQVCLLRGFPSFIYLRKFTDHYIIVGRSSVWINAIHQWRGIGGGGPQKEEDEGEGEEEDKDKEEREESQELRDLVEQCEEETFEIE